MAIEPLPGQGESSRNLVDQWGYRTSQRVQDMDEGELAEVLVEFEDLRRAVSSDYASGAVRALMLSAQGRLARLRRDRERREVDAHPDRAARRSILQQLAVAGPTRPRELAPAVGVTREHVSRVLASLQAEGLTSKSKGHGLDRRAVVHQMTDAGVAELQRLRRLEPDPEPTAEQERAATLAAAAAVLRRHRDHRRLHPERAAGLDAPERVRQAADELGDGRLYWDAVGELVTTCRQAGDESGARKALRMFENSGPRSDFQLAWRCYQNAKLDGGENQVPQLRAAWDRIRPVGDSELSVWAGHALAVAHYQQGRLLTARSFCVDAYEQACRLNDEFAMIKTGARLALIHRVLGDPRESQRTLDSVLPLAQRRGFQSLYAECLLQAGETYRYLGDFGRAILRLKEARDLWEDRSVHRRETAFTWSALGSAYFDAGDLESAESALLKVVELEPRSHLDDVRTLSLRRYSALSFAQNHTFDARDAAKRALRIYSNLSDIGTVESLACLAVASESPRSSLLDLKTHLESLAAQSRMSGGLFGADLGLPPPGDWPKRVLERWVLHLARRAADESGAHAEFEQLEVSWKVLEREGYAARKQVRLSNSVMGKEPALVLAA